MGLITEGAKVKHPTFGVRGSVQLQGEVVNMSDDGKMAQVSNPFEAEPAWLPVDELELAKEAPNSPFTLE
ncbi:hypothetical protein [Spirosoma agri]|uniref:Uncharacterized protein n=1 Tax=Spirosoma agri TaxID=1987381 RepID=A0A6M0II82_9BACT|nr:hypothetical protein [Spirosoma agri]NEU67938.1 hypothetical protein [Spirosoma agri]